MPSNLTRLFATTDGLFLCSALAAAAPSDGDGLQAISGTNPGGDGKVGVR